MPDPADFSDIGDARTSKRSAQWWLLYAILVANKPAEITRTKLDALLRRTGAEPYPFHEIEFLISVGRLGDTLRKVRTGQYTRIEAAFRDVVVKLPPVAGDDPRNWSLETLETIPGVGPKTARWFYLLINPDAPVAALDTHVLKFLSDNGVDGVPRATPARGRKYKRLESEFVEHARRLGLSSRDLDFFAWSIYRNGGHIYTGDQNFSSEGQQEHDVVLEALRHA